MRLTTLTTCLGLAALLALGLSGTARGLTFSGDLDFGGLVLPGPVLLGVSHTNGFGGARDAGPVTANLGGPDVGLAFGTLTTPLLGLSSAEAAGHYDVGAFMGSWSFTNGAITLTQTDLDPLTPNGVAEMRVIMALRWQAPKMTVAELDVSFDTVTNAAAGDTAEFSMDVCHGMDSFEFHDFINALDPYARCEPLNRGVLGALSKTTAQILAAGGTIANSLTLARSDIAPMDQVTYLALDLTVKNDSGPVTLSLENFQLSISEVPAPGATVLVALTLGWLWIRHRPSL